jgi:hypothetical protein
MKYALLIYDDDTAWAGLSEDEKAELRAKEMPRWAALMEELGKADPELKGFELDARQSAKVVQVRSGQRIVIDGPFAETKEALGGLFVVDLPDLDEAIRLASMIPAAEDPGCIEIRPILQ